ncbi:MAG: hypothetical protein IPP97_10275 [Candidatus Obscuribacter sp.]|nr:hypothetical protein [Candidatus Obscuribacter sp.]
MNSDQVSTNRDRPVHIQTERTAYLHHVATCDQRQLQPIAGRIGLWPITDQHFNGSLPLILGPSVMPEVDQVDIRC